MDQLSSGIWGCMPAPYRSATICPCTVTTVAADSAPSVKNTSRAASSFVESTPTTEGACDGLSPIGQGIVAASASAVSMIGGSK